MLFQLRTGGNLSDGYMVRMSHSKSAYLVDETYVKIEKK